MESTNEKLHFRDLLIDLFHKENYEVHNLVLVETFCVEVCDEERYVISLDDEFLASCHEQRGCLIALIDAHLDRLPSQDEK